jgi:hypothetical protein
LRTLVTYVVLMLVLQLEAPVNWQLALTSWFSFMGS